MSSNHSRESKKRSKSLKRKRISNFSLFSRKSTTDASTFIVFISLQLLTNISSGLSLSAINIITRSSGFTTSPVHYLPPVRRSRCLFVSFDNHFRSQKSSSLVLSETTARVDEIENNDKKEAWTAGDVIGDMENLRQAVEYSRGPERLAATQRKFMLNEFAKNRRPIFPDLIRFILVPLVTGLGMVSIMLSTNHSGNIISLVGQRSVQQLCRIMNFHYLLIVFLSNFKAIPLLFSNKKHQMKNSSSAAATLNLPDMGGLTWMNPKKVVFDPPRFLWESWTSAILGTFILYTVSLTNVRTRSNLISGLLLTNLHIPDRDLTFAYALVQMMTRIAALVSIYQYPKVWFELKREDQPKPLSKQFSYMTRILKNMKRGFPLGVVCDLSMVITSILKLSQPNPLLPTTTALPKRFYIAIFLSLLGPLCHLFAFFRLFQFQFTSNLSLSTPYDKAKKILSNDYVRHSLYRWRWSLKWRKPETIRKVLFNWYRFFLTGYSSREDRTLSKQNEMFASYLATNGNKKCNDIESLGISERPFKNELLRLEAERCRTNDLPIDNQFIDRRIWVSNSMNVMAQQHQENYEEKVFDDYLGVALQQTLDIGFSFDYDHESDLSKEEQNSPSIHRLRARATKSAIAHIRQMYNPHTANERLLSIADSNEKEREKSLMQTEIRKTEKDLVEQLINLSPSNADAPEGTEQLEMQLMAESQIPGKISSNKCDFVAQVGDSPDLMEGMMRKEFGDDYVDDPWVQQGIRNEDITQEELNVMIERARKDAANSSSIRDGSLKKYNDANYDNEDRLLA